MTSPSDRADLLGELAWRGLLYDHTERLGDALAAGSVTGYCGFDPTADSLHVGNLVQIMGLLHLQRAGHRPIVLLGGGTGLIGDPSGKSTERPLLGAEQVAANAQAIGAQLGRFLDFSGPRGARIHDNAEWLVETRTIAFLRDIGKHFSINFMLAKDSVRSRLEGGISFTEFAYMLLQAYDFLELHRREGCTLQTGGSDQWGNITAGIELIKRAAGGEAHGLVLPLVTTASGTKFGKTEAGAVWLDPKRTSVYRFYQFWVNADDRDIGRYFRFFTLLSADEITALDTATRESPERREAQQVLALDVTTRVHGVDAARVASEVSAILFGRGDPRALSPEALAALAAEIPSSMLDGDGSTTIEVVDAFVAAGLAPSKGAARRLLDQGGLSVNGRRLAPSDRTLPPDDALVGRYYLLRKGSRDYALVQTRG